MVTVDPWFVECQSERAELDHALKDNEKIEDLIPVDAGTEE